jgi:hypothetical protein
MIVNKRRFLRPATLLMLLGCGFATKNAQASDVVVTIHNDHPMSVNVELYSASRQTAWPGNGETWTLADKVAKEFPISCEQGETICYGAWISDNREVFWGIGPDRDQPCDNCCFTCESDGANNINLTDE